MRIFISLCALLVCLFVGSDHASAHSKAITDCKGNIVYKQAKLMKPAYVVESNGLIAEEYDTNNDKQTDVIALSHPQGTGHNQNPIFWIVDLDFDGDAEAIYVDKNGLGKCTDIVLYEDLTTPLGIPLNPRKPLNADRGGKL